MLKKEGRIILIKTTKMKINLFFFIMYSNGRRKSFWKWKFDNSPFSRNFIDNCLSESTQKNETSSFKLQPTYEEKNQCKSNLAMSKLHKCCNAYDNNQFVTMLVITFNASWAHQIGDSKNATAVTLLTTGKSEDSKSLPSILFLHTKSDLQ